MSNAVKVTIAVMLAVIIGSVGFIGGFAVAKVAPNALRSQEPSALGSQVEEVNELLRNEALEPPSETSATAGAIQGLLDSGEDKYGLYFDPRHFKFFSEESMGAFGGIGVVLGEKNGTAYVVEVYKGTPAEKAGIKTGDIFTKIGEVRRDKWTTDEVVKRVRGEAGTKVTLTMIRPGAKDKPGKEYETTVTRAMIKLPNLESEMKGDVGYIRLSQFNGNSTDEIAKAVESLKKKGAKSYVLDLRDNPGGLLQQAIEVTSLFVDSGTVVRVEERNREPVDHRTIGSKISDAPLVVLINGNSASASEIVAGALQDYGRAQLVGEKSFGKGSVQSIKELSFGGAIKFTTAHYLTPKGRAIDGIGLTPDVIVTMEAEKQAEEATDIQLKKAIQIAEKAAR